MVPSWRNLVIALKHPKVGQIALADRIAKEKQVLVHNFTHVLEITNYLQGLEKTDLYNLGLVLGLSLNRVTHLQKRYSCLEFCDNIVNCWLQRVDDVEAMNMVPSWRNLVIALEHPTVGQTALAGRISKEKQLFIQNFTHLLEITNYLQGLEKTDLYNLGIVLGLSLNRVTYLQERYSCLEFCDNIVNCWLQRVDGVDAMNMVPSWRNLVLALKHPRVGQTGLADRIAKERELSECFTYCISTV